jgi:hypothetical protein
VCGHDRSERQFEWVVDAAGVTAQRCAVCQPPEESCNKHLLGTFDAGDSLLALYDQLAEVSLLVGE